MEEECYDVLYSVIIPSLSCLAGTPQKQEWVESRLVGHERGSDVLLCVIPLLPLQRLS